MVRIIEWGEELSVGIKEFDDQHKELVEILDIFYSALLQEKGAEVQGSILERLADYTRRHFETEERYFKKHGYPEEKEHKKEHDEMLIMLDKFIKEHKRGNRLIGVDLLYFIRDWFEDHMKTTDYRYIDFFEAKGVARRGGPA